MDRWGARAHQLASRLIKRDFSKTKSSPSKLSRQTERFWSWIGTRAVRDDATFEGMKDLKPAFNRMGRLQLEIPPL